MRASTALAKHRKDFRKPGVISVYPRGKTIRVLVDSPETASQIPRSISGVPVEISIRSQAQRMVSAPTFPSPIDTTDDYLHQQYQRPLMGGISIGPLEGSCGTLGCLLYRGERLVGLSNNHVLTEENDLPLGTSIIQPSDYDNGTEIVGTLGGMYPLKPEKTNLIDAAYFWVETPAEQSFLGLGPLQGITQFQPGDIVFAASRTTGIKGGRVVSLEGEVNVQYEQLGLLAFRRQIVLEEFDIQPGDSGSGVVDPLNNLGGLLFAGIPSEGDQPGIGFANPIALVLRALGLTVRPTNPAPQPLALASSGISPWPLMTLLGFGAGVGCIALATRN